MSNGATPVFCDINPKTLGLDVEEAERLITPRTKAICIVHYAGFPASPEEFEILCAKHGITLIEDNAHGLGGLSHGRPLGTFGSLSTLSFHETKNLSCGEGGALVINDAILGTRAEVLREKGTDRSRFLRGQVDKYTWVDLGASWVLSDLLATLLSHQLDHFSEIQERRKAVWAFYMDALKDWADEGGIGIPGGLPSESVAHMFFLIMEDRATRDEMISHLRAEGVTATFHYQPLHESPFGKKWVRAGQHFPNTVKVSDGLVRLPLYPHLSAQEVQKVCDTVVGFRLRR